MRRSSVLFLAAFLASCTTSAPIQNPDPNHTHADFAVWLDGKEVDLSDEIYMSGSSTETEHADAHHPSFHLHDGNGHVIHRHKPGLTLGEFFDSLPGIRYRGNEFLFMDCLGCKQAAGTWQTVLYVNGEKRLEGSAYVFSDLDHVLITDGTDPVEIRKALRSITDDACLYSKTCPDRGDPPAEGCIADPTVPCVVE